MKVALVYDRVNKWGGAERVLLALHAIFPTAPLYTAVYNKNKASWADVFEIKPSFLTHIPFATTSHEIFAMLMPLAFESFNFDAYDLVISVTSEAAKGIITKPSTRHICYCLTPTRYLWSGYNDYFSGRLFKIISSPAVSLLRRWDQIAAKRPDQIIAISKEVRGRVRKYYDRDARVIYPPLMLEKKSTTIENGDFFLVVSRLVPYKRIDLAIKACNQLNLPLHIIGTGTEEALLKSIAGPTIQFHKNVSDDELIRYYQKCFALLFPGREDFGLVMIEALQYGKPVIAYKEGGAYEIVDHTKAGILFPSQTVSSLKRALQQFESKNFDPDICRRVANKFSFATFRKNILRMVG